MRTCKKIINCIGAAFAVYSRIPVPEAAWDPETLRWQICFFPLVGAVIGFLWSAAGILLTGAGAEPVLTGAVLSALPLLVTGGIHMDGFLDTSDAVHSWKSTEERQRILKDPHMGAFAFICGAVYLLLYFASAVQLASLLGKEAASSGRIPYPPFFMMSAGFILCRILSGLSVIYFPKAKKDGMLRETADASDQKAGRVLIAELAAVCVLLAAGAYMMRRPEAALLPLPAGAIFLYYRQMAVKTFGGVSGDLAGWFLQMCELLLLWVVVLSAAVR